MHTLAIFENAHAMDNDNTVYVRLRKGASGEVWFEACRAGQVWSQLVSLHKHDYLAVWPDGIKGMELCWGPVLMPGETFDSAQIVE